MRRLLAGLAVHTIILVMACASIGGTNSIRMSREEVKDLIGKPDVYIIDVRTGSSYSDSRWKIKGAVREAPFDAKEWAPKYSTNGTIILYCC